jgi:hypothetical protein
MPTPPFPAQPNPEDSQELPEYPEEIAGLPLKEEQTRLDEPVTTAEQPLSPSDPESVLPPEALGETNGGPLGCCLGITVGILISLLLGVIGLGPLVASVIVFLLHTDAITNTRIATAFFALVGAILGAYFGWKIGQRLYREYEPPVIKDRTRKPKTRPKEAKL